MPAISLHQLSYRTPDGRTLFEHLDLGFGPLRTGLVGRNGVGKSTLLSLIAGERLPSSGTVSVDGTLGFLRQTVQASPEASVATALGVEDAFDVLARLERGEGTAEDAADADWTLPQRAAAALDAVGLHDLPPGRALATFSGGQQTRLSLAALLLSRPDFILLDEPTNNLDAEGRETVARVLESWRGGAIVVSHDRALLRHMDAVVELTSLGATTYGGNYDLYRERKDLELASAAAALDDAEQHLAEVRRRTQVQAERQARRNGAGKRSGREGGVPRIVLGGMKRRAEVTSGNVARLGIRLREQAAGQLEEARSRLEVLQPVTARLMPTGLAAGRRVLEAHQLSGGPDGLPLIENFDLTITGPERLAITGPNGAGKTTLLRLLTGELQPTRGSIAIGVRFAMLDQSLSLLEPAATIRDNYLRLNPGDDENSCRAALARLKFRADAALQQVSTLSGGEMIRAALAVTIGSGAPPELLILDEPTNHLDLDAIAAVEAGLVGYDGALLVVSHDRDFVAAIGITREIELGEGQTRLKVK
jgi:ATPase subunit of ABC transporter with duplicated ATPase domains